jgi:hypothetical protein
LTSCVCTFTLPQMPEKYRAIEVKNLENVVVPDEIKAALLVLTRHGDNENARKAAMQVIIEGAVKVYESASQSQEEVRGGVGDSVGGWTVTTGGQENKGGIKTEPNLQDSAVNVVDTFDQANTNQAIEKTGSRGKLLQTAISVLRARLNSGKQRTILNSKQAGE